MREQAINDYQSFHAALRYRAEELKVAGSTLEDVSGLTSGYISKLLGPSQARRIGWESLGPLLGVLCVKLVLIEDPDAVRRFGPRLVKRCEQQVRHVRCVPDQMVHGT